MSTGTQKTDLSRFKIEGDKLFGIYRGVVEDRIDPLRLGRVRVRVWGVHTEEQGGDYNKVPYDELVWAHPIGPNFEGGVSGQGAFCVPVQGSHVFVFFESGNLMQPRYFGTSPGYPIDGAKFQQNDPQDGFIDPDEWYPLDDHIKEQDWNRLARVEKLSETYLQLKNDNLDLGVAYAFGGTWDEQPPMYEAEYPDNNVFATHDDYDENIVIELDATFGSERFAWWHPSKSYMEVNWEGRMTFRNTFHRWDICDGIVHTHYMMHHFRTISDSLITLVEKSEWREVMVDRWTEIHGNDWRKIGGDSWEDIAGNEICYVGGNRDEIVDGNETYYIAGELNHGVEGDYKEQTDGNKESTILSDMKKYIVGDYIHTVEGDAKDLVWGNLYRYVDTQEHLTVVDKKLSYVDLYWSDDTGDKRTIHSALKQTLHADTSVVMKGEVTASIEGGTSVIIKGGIASLKGDSATQIDGAIVNVGTGVVNIGSTVRIGPMVMLGQAAGVAATLTPLDPEPPEDPEIPESEQPEISTPAEPPTNPAPPGPDIPPPFVPPDNVTTMPEPGCP